MYIYCSPHFVFLLSNLYIMSFVLYALAFIMLIVGLPALATPKKFMKVMEGIVKNADMVRIMSMWTLFLAFFFLAMYPLLKGGWLMLISILGWIMLVKAVVLLWFPRIAQWKFSFFCGTKLATMLLWIFCVLFSAFLVWAGIVKF